MTSSTSVAIAQLPLFAGARQARSEDGALGIERSFDVAFVARLALKEKQIQHLSRALLLSEFGAAPLSEGFYQPHAASTWISFLIFTSLEIFER